MNDTTTRPESKRERERIAADLARKVGRVLDTYNASSSRVVSVVDLWRSLGMPNRDDLHRAVRHALATRTHWLHCGRSLVLSRRLQGAAKA
jgi:hypothetical protein